MVFIYIPPCIGHVLLSLAGFNVTRWHCRRAGKTRPPQCVLGREWEPDRFLPTCRSLKLLGKLTLDGATDSRLTSKPPRGHLSRLEAPKQNRNIHTTVLRHPNLISITKNTKANPNVSTQVCGMFSKKKEKKRCV